MGKLDKILSGVKINEPWFIELQETKSTRGLATILFEIGFVGDFVQGGQGGNQIFYSVDNHTPSFTEVQVHPCFRKAVKTVERNR